MTKTYIYKITRLDDMEYIGITIRLNKRIRDHTKSPRFFMGIKRISILGVCDTYEKAEELEELYISQFDTYHNGLNESINGKGNHLSPKFTTRGMIYAEESRAKMRKNHWSKTGYKSGMSGKKHREDTRKKWSEKRKGLFWGDRKISKEESMRIYRNYVAQNVSFSNEYISKFVKKKDVEKTISGDFSNLEELCAPNGKPLNYRTVFSKYYSEKYNVTPQAINRIIKNEGISSDDYKEKQQI